MYFSLILKKPWRYYNFNFVDKKKRNSKTLAAQGHLVADEGQGTWVYLKPKHVPATTEAKLLSYPKILSCF